MKIAKFVVPVFALLALALALGGCPKDKMMGEATNPAAPQIVETVG